MEFSLIVRKEIKKVCGKDVAADTHLRDDLNLSSLAFIQSLTNLCKAFDIDVYSLSDRDFSCVKTVGDLEALLESRVAAR